MFVILCCPVKGSRFFTSFRMTDYYTFFVKDGGRGRLTAMPSTYPYLKHKRLIVISNVVRNLLQSFIYKVYWATMICNTLLSWWIFLNKLKVYLVVYWPSARIAKCLKCLFSMLLTIRFGRIFYGSICNLFIFKLNE